jgi:hypothetical protein
MIKKLMTTESNSCIIETEKLPAWIFRLQTTALIRIVLFTVISLQNSFTLMRFSKRFKRYSLSVISSFAVLALNVSAQAPIKLIQPQPQPEASDDLTWWYGLTLLLVAGLIAAVYWHLKDRKVKKIEAELKAANQKRRQARADDALDFDSELEWLRKNKKIIGKKPVQKQTAAMKRAAAAKEQAASRQTAEAVNPDAFAQKLEKLKFSQLPIAQFNRIEMARPFMPLPLSRDESLLSAIEQTQDEFEEDETVRELALKILARFKTKNSVESLSQIALYDLSSSLRARAIGILSDFDHESVFETLLLACADPTREVRAAAARGLFRLSFDRADCWMRITESGDEYRMRHAARAAIAGGLVERAFDRLVHEDRKVAYEVFALVVLLIRSGETREVFDALENHPDPNVRKAILHIIKLVGDPDALEYVSNLSGSESLSEEMRQEIEKLVEEAELVAA